MFYVGYIFGVLSSGLLIFLGFYFSRVMSGQHLDTMGTKLQPMPAIFGRKPKRVPKSISEEQQWKREQREAPADPT